jgi:hypothetical protein
MACYRGKNKKNLCHLCNLWFHLPIFFVAKIRRLTAVLFGFGYLVVKERKGDRRESGRIGKN